jgi:RNA polymerase sigma-70 factor (sigma-E family)
VPVDDFEAFVRERWAALARIAYLLTSDRHLAEDLLQDTLARAAERWRAIVRGGDPEPYVRRMLYTRAIDGWRYRRRAVTASAAQRPELQSPGDGAEIIARRLVLRDALARLTPRQRAVLVLRFYEDHTEAHTADLLGYSVNTVKSQTRHALNRLRAMVPDLAETFDRHSPLETQ